jgi:hypothetical protein
MKTDLLSYTGVFTCVLAFGCITTFRKETAVLFLWCNIFSPLLPAVADAG